MLGFADGSCVPNCGRSRGSGIASWASESWVAINKLSGQRKPAKVRSSETNGRVSQPSASSKRQYRGILIVKLHDCSRVHHCSQIYGIPVRQTDAAMGCGFADVLWLRCAVNAVGRGCQIDPNHAHRIIGPGRDSQLAVRFHALPGEFRIVVVVSRQRAEP